MFTLLEVHAAYQCNDLKSIMWSFRDLEAWCAGFEKDPGYSWAREAHMTSPDNEVKRRSVMVVLTAQLVDIVVS